VKGISITNHRWRDRPSISMSWLWFSCLALLLLLPPVSFAQSHLWQYRPFRANDTDHSGGDHICDLRRDSNADGKPDMLGHSAVLRGTVIVEPLTFECDGCLFWIREAGCGIPVYGDPENLRLGDSVSVRGQVGLGIADPAIVDTLPACLCDIILKKGGSAVRCGVGEDGPVPVMPVDFAGRPECYAGNLVSLTEPVKVTRTVRTGAGLLAWGSSSGDSLIVYADDDVACTVIPGRLYLVTGVVMHIVIPSGSAASTHWCIAPRNLTDVIDVGYSPACRTVSWGRLKTEYQIQRQSTSGE